MVANAEEKVHVSFRLPRSLVASIDEIAERTGGSRAHAAEVLLDEGVRSTRHPGIVFRPGPAGRRAAVVGGPDVWEVVSVWRENDSDIRTTADYLSLPLVVVTSALDYYHWYSAEVDDWIRRNDAEARRVETRSRQAAAPPR
ncbi:MAG: hypothetical protein ACR2MY_01535 [Candidatus Dormibacteria bacterium]